MALRRPPSRATKPSSSSGAMPPPRARSALAKITSSTRSADDSDPTLTPLVSRHTSKQPSVSSVANTDSETNIQVVIRCRRRSEREKQDNSPAIVTSNGAKSNTVSIETTAPSSTLGIVTLPPTRTYPFDLVFGPEADQALIYNEVVTPMLEEVLTGYNCTLFAYGQTGTGKTYTMQGDLEPSPMGNPSVHAGMIPRALFWLFHHLETKVSDYSVKVSYVELYNEELRDLLANDLAPPTGNTQPMGKDSSKGGDGGLKLFEDPSKKGVIIQGVEEVPVKDCRDALAQLRKGSERRQIAATKFNDHSSRSHSIFSITVHTKEKTGPNDESLSIGKLNLVDLAGSENIGRSGAENKRAREAGMINQSLLTLGRVINALVDKAQHVPYRESKLTRLLQDSLGGRTKTCIVATVSPARSNLEETLSTLDYALKAKSIHNKPEVNQRMTRNSLIKEYVGEIERLKADILAAREKNGIYFSEETWNQLAAEQEIRKTDLEEAKKHVEIVEGQIRVIRGEYEESIGRLKLTEKELSSTQQRLQETEYTLNLREIELEKVQMALEEEIFVRQAHQNTEAKLDGVASELKTAVHASLQDVGNLHDKLARKGAVLDSNVSAVLNHGTSLSASTQKMTTQLEAYLSNSSKTHANLLNEAKEFEDKEVKALQAFSSRISQQLDKMQQTIHAIHAHDRTESQALTDTRGAITASAQTLKDELSAWQVELQKSTATILESASHAGRSAIEDAKKAIHSLTSLVDTAARDVSQHVEHEQKTISAATILAQEASALEIKRLEEQNETLAALLDSERVKSSRAKDELISRVSGLLGDFVNQRDQSLREAVGAVQSNTLDAADNMVRFSDNHGQAMETLAASASSSASAMQGCTNETKRLRDGSFKTLESSKTNLSKTLSDSKSKLSHAADDFSDRVKGQMAVLQKSGLDGLERHDRAKRARLDMTDSMGTDTKSTYRYLEGGIASTSSTLGQFSNSMQATVSKLNDSTRTMTSTSRSQLSIMQTTQRDLMEQGTIRDLSTSTTPKKRTWKFEDQWELTKPREELVRTWREKGVSNVGSETFLAEHLPLPDEDAETDFREVPVTPTLEAPPPPMALESPPPDSTSTAASVPPPAPVPITRTKSTRSVKPPSGPPLVDSRNVYTTRGSRRR